MDRREGWKEERKEVGSVMDGVAAADVPHPNKSCIYVSSWMRGLGANGTLTCVCMYVHMHGQFFLLRAYVCMCEKAQWTNYPAFLKLEIPSGLHSAFCWSHVADLCNLNPWHHSRFLSLSILAFRLVGTSADAHSATTPYLLYTIYS